MAEAFNKGAIGAGGAAGSGGGGVGAAVQAEEPRVFRTTCGKRDELARVSPGHVDFEWRAPTESACIAAPNGLRGGGEGGLSVWFTRLHNGLIEDSELRGLSEAEALARMRKARRTRFKEELHVRYALYSTSQTELPPPRDWGVCDRRDDGHALVRPVNAAPYAESLVVLNVHPPEAAAAHEITRADVRWVANAPHSAWRFEGVVLRNNAAAYVVPDAMRRGGKPRDLLTMAGALARVADFGALDDSAEAVEALEELREHGTVLSFVQDGGPYVDTAERALVRLLHFSSDDEDDEGAEDEPTIDEVAAAQRALDVLRAATAEMRRTMEEPSRAMLLDRSGTACSVDAAEYMLSRFPSIVHEHDWWLKIQKELFAVDVANVKLTGARAFEDHGQTYVMGPCYPRVRFWVKDGTWRHALGAGGDAYAATLPPLLRKLLDRAVAAYSGKSATEMVTLLHDSETWRLVGHKAGQNAPITTETIAAALGGRVEQSIVAALCADMLPSGGGGMGGGAGAVGEKRKNRE
jgi:hypothetical protein